MVVLLLVVYSPRMLGHGDYVFLLRVVDGVLTNTGDVRFRQIRADIPQVVHVGEELEKLGFVLQGGKKYCLEDGFELESLRQHRQRIQDLADMTLDPNSISLAQVAEVLQLNGRLPGINNTINDEPIGDVVDLGAAVERPKKPWEN